ncbi:unnamed protein product, partial [Brenthis ino]
MKGNNERSVRIEYNTKQSVGKATRGHTRPSFEADYYSGERAKVTTLRIELYSCFGTAVDNRADSNDKLLKIFH